MDLGCAQTSLRSTSTQRTQIVTPLVTVVAAGQLQRKLYRIVRCFQQQLKVSLLVTLAFQEDLRVTGCFHEPLAAAPLNAELLAHDNTRTSRRLTARLLTTLPSTHS